LFWSFSYSTIDEIKSTIALLFYRFLVSMYLFMAFSVISPIDCVKKKHMLLKKKNWKKATKAIHYIKHRIALCRSDWSTFLRTSFFFFFFFLHTMIVIEWKKNDFFLLVVSEIITRLQIDDEDEKKRMCEYVRHHLLSFLFFFFIRSRWVTNSFWDIWCLDFSFYL
jgi:hypothetical protein